jgi:hypothetical protein
MNQKTNKEIRFKLCYLPDLLIAFKNSFFKFNLPYDWLKLF